MVVKMTEKIETVMNTTHSVTNLFTTTLNNQVNEEDSDKDTAVAVSTAVFFSFLVALTSGGLLLIFIIHRHTAKNASLIMISTLANLSIGAIAELAFRTPYLVMGEQGLADVHPKLCVVVLLLPDYFMIAILLCLPLLSIERLLRLETKEHLNARQSRTLFACLLVIAYSLAFVISILPTTNLFAAGVNTRCNNNLVYGNAFPYVYTAMTITSVMITAVFSIAVAFRLKHRLSHLGTTQRKKIILKQGTVSAIAITGLLFVALVPFAASLQVLLMCDSKQIDDEQFCTEVSRPILFRACIIIQKTCLIALPLVFLWLNPTLRRKVWLTIKKPKQMENVVTISSNSMSVSKDSISTSNCLEEGDLDIDGDGDFITITEDLSFGKCGDVNGEVKRRCIGPGRHKQSVLDLVEVLSVISERSESGRSITEESSNK